MVCTTKDLYKSVKKCPGARIAPGIRARIFFILKSQILTWPTLPTPGDEKNTDPAKFSQYTGNFTLAGDAKWHCLDLVDAKSNFTSETQGEAPSATFLNKGEFIVGGTDEDITGFATMAINDELIMMVQDRKGRSRVIGCEAFAPKITVSQASGSGVTDSCTTTVNTEATDFCPTPFYTGKIETDDGDISGADGSVWEAA